MEEIASGQTQLNDILTRLTQSTGKQAAGSPPAPSSNTKPKSRKRTAGAPTPPPASDPTQSVLDEILSGKAPPDLTGRTAQTPGEQTAARNTLDEFTRGLQSAIGAPPDHLMPPELVGVRNMLGLSPNTPQDRLQVLHDTLQRQFSKTPKAQAWFDTYAKGLGTHTVSTAPGTAFPETDALAATPEGRSALQWLANLREQIAQGRIPGVEPAKAPASVAPAAPTSNVRPPITSNVVPPTPSASTPPPPAPPRNFLGRMVDAGQNLLQRMANRPAPAAPDTTGPLVAESQTAGSSASLLTPEQREAFEQRKAFEETLRQQREAQAQRMATLADQPLEEPAPLTAEQVRQRAGEQPLGQRVREGYEDFLLRAADAATRPVNFENLTDFGRTLMESGQGLVNAVDRPLFGSERPTPEQLRADTMRGLTPEPARTFAGEEVPEQRVWQDAEQRQNFQDFNDKVLRPDIEEFAPDRSPKRSFKNASDYANLIEPDVTRDHPGVRTTRVSPLERPIGSAPRIEPGTRPGFSPLNEPMLAGGKYVPGTTGIPEAPPPHFADRLMETASKINQKAFIPLMMASEAVPEALEGNYGQAALNTAKGAGTLAGLHLLNTGAEAVMNNGLRAMTPGVFGTGRLGGTMADWRGMAMSNNLQEIPGFRYLPKIANIANRGFGILGGLGAASQLYDDTGASADVMDKYTGGRIARKGLAATALGLGFVPWAGMALGAGTMVGHGIIDPIARKVGPNLSFLGLGGSYNNFGLKEAHGWGVPKEEGGPGERLPVDEIKDNVKSALHEAGKLIDPSTGRGTPQYTAMVEGMTQKLMDMGFSKEAVVNMYNEAEGGRIKSQPGWVNTKAPSLAELRAQGIDPNAFATGALDRYTQHRNAPPASLMPPNLPLPQQRITLAQMLGAPVVSAGQATLLNPNGFRPLMPSRSDINF